MREANKLFCNSIIFRLCSQDATRAEKTRELFEKIGGYREIPLMEDYQLSMDIKDLGIKIRQCDSKIITRSVRYEKGGMLKTMYKMQKYQHMYRKGVSPEEIVERYRNVR